MSEKNSKAWYATSIGRFRTVAMAEGVSFLILLGIAMPLKYVAGKPGMVDVFGWIHGLLFISYMITGLQLKIEHEWPAGKTALAVVAALIPFGPFILDKKILQKEMQDA
jgi:integral membrane protein